ncbi:MAG: LysM peptidoglycan-binding domain-containing protein [Alphaproteobacteria bacterium]|nr:LysM peptidoglycan-binding domain-containing protein [Alphaproteobacteria bacterium]
MSKTTIIAIVGALCVVVALLLGFRGFFVPEPPPPNRTPSPPVASAPAMPAPAPQAAAPIPLPETAGVRPPSSAAARSPTGEAVIAGRGATNAPIVILDGEKEIGRVTADGRGEWVFVTVDPLAPGPHELRLRMDTDKGPVWSERNVAVVVPPRGTGTGGGPLVALLPAEGTGPATVLQVPGPGVGSQRMSIDAIDYGDAGSVTVTGKGTAGATVRLYADNKSVGEAVVGPDGRWRVDIPQLGEGNYTLRADELGANGRGVAARAETPFQRAAVPAPGPGEQIVVVQPGNSLWRISRRIYGEGLRYTTIYEANRDQIRNADLIYPGQIFAIPKTN